MPKLSASQVSVPRRALRGHAPGAVVEFHRMDMEFQCPEGR